MSVIEYVGLEKIIGKKIEPAMLKLVELLFNTMGMKDETGYSAFKDILIRAYRIEVSKWTEQLRRDIKRYEEKKGISIEDKIINAILRMVDVETGFYIDVETDLPKERLSLKLNEFGKGAIQFITNEGIQSSMVGIGDGNTKIVGSSSVTKEAESIMRDTTEGAREHYESMSELYSESIDLPSDPNEVIFDTEMSDIARGDEEVELGVNLLKNEKYMELVKKDLLNSSSLRITGDNFQKLSEGKDGMSEAKARENQLELYDDYVDKLKLIVGIYHLD